MINVRSFTRHHYVAAFSRRWRAFAARGTRRWARTAFADFETVAGRRNGMIASVVADAVALRGLARALAVNQNGGRRVFVDALLQACRRVDSGDVRHQSEKLRSYVDVSVQFKALRVFANYLSRQKVFAGDPINVTALVLAEASHSRPALLAQAELLLERGQTDAAIAIIQRALRIQAVCPSAQQLLARAHAAQRANGEREGILDGTNYDLTDKFCPLPFTSLSTGYKGDSFACQCPAWVPYPVGNLVDAPSAEAVWNSDVAAEIRRSVHDGDFKYCSRTLCSFIAAQKLPDKKDITDPKLRRYITERAVVLDEMPTTVELNHDPSCNLACPSCRTGIVTATPKEQTTYLDAAQRTILPMLKKVNGLCYISGGGEPFASKHYLTILSVLNREEYPGLYLYLVTNGLLATAERWRSLPNLPEMIDVLSVSIDAARAETYEQLRRPGKWPVLMKNLELMAEMRRRRSIRRLEINFVVQAANYREIPEFIELGDRLRVDSIWLQRVTNYGSFTESVFTKADVTSPQHPEHEQLLAILRSPIMNHPALNLRMLKPLLPEVVAADCTDAILWNLSRDNVEEVRWGAIDALRSNAALESPLAGKEKNDAAGHLAQQANMQ